MSILKTTLTIITMAISSISCSAQTVIDLVSPSKTGGLSIIESLWQRHSDREFATRPLSDQDLSDLLFAASGVNRPDEEKITSPSALNTQEIDLYVFTAEGVYKYIPQGHKLQTVAAGDHRSLIAGTPQFSQDFVLQAPVSLLTVANPQKFTRMADTARTMAIADAGIMTENICLFCAGKGLAAVPRATMDSEAISKLLSLDPLAFPVLNIPVGYPN